MSASWNGRERPLNIAHRGDTQRAPENTMAAVEAARGAGAHGVEVDVQLARDGVPMVFHDRDLWRVTGTVGEVAALTSRVLARRTVHAQHPDAEAREARIPRLDQVVHACGDDLLLNLELKVHDAGDVRTCLRLASACAEVLRSAKLEDRLLISSFHPLALMAMRRALPEARLGFLFHAGQSFALQRGLPAITLYPRIIVHPERKLISHRFVARWRAVGARIHVWTVDDPREMTLMISLGIDAIVTNRPRLLGKVIGWGPRGWRIAQARESGDEPPTHRSGPMQS